MKKLAIAVLLLAATSVHAAGLDVVAVQYRDVAQSYGAEGLVEATRQSTVSAQISGRVVEVNFDVGDKVGRGQLILKIDEREAAQAQAASGAQLMQAQANVQNAKSTYERSRQLYAQKFISQAALDKAEVDYKVALAQAAASQAGAGQASLTRGYTAVTAPFAGVVSARMVEPGEMVMPGKPLMTGFDPSELRVIVSVPQYRLAQLGTNPDVMVEIPTQGRWIKAASARVQPVADARTHSTQVRVYLPAGEAGIYPGMFVRAHFVTGRAKKLVVPAAAVLHRGEVVAAYVADGKGALSLRQIRVGEAAAEGYLEVLSGLSEGERVAADAIKAGMSR